MEGLASAQPRALFKPSAEASELLFWHIANPLMAAAIGYLAGGGAAAIWMMIAGAALSYARALLALARRCVRAVLASSAPRLREGIGHFAEYLPASFQRIVSRRSRP